MRVFLAGATGAIGKRLVPRLLDAGHAVVGTTRTNEKGQALRAAGVEPCVVDVFEASALSDALSTARADIVIDQLTDLPPGLDASRIAEGIKRNARIRSGGTQNLVAAMLRAGVHRLIVQSIAWMYAPGNEPHAEDDPLDVKAQGLRAVTMAGVLTLERLAVSSPPIQGVILRYGHLYGPGTGTERPGEAPSLHVDAAAAAAVLALERAAPGGAYNIADPDGYLSIEKARRVLDLDPSFHVASNEPHRA
jgi:nucleoside-diphosphate-sugar epimerase